MESTYFIRSRGRVTGPFEESELRRMISRGQLTRIHELSPDGVQWALLTEYSQFISSPGSLAPRNIGSHDSALPSTAPSAPPNLPAYGLHPADDATLNRNSGWLKYTLLIGGTIAACLLIVILASLSWQGPTAGKPPSDEQLYSQLRASVGRVIVGFQGTVNEEYVEKKVSAGTAFLVSSRGYYLTNKHVIEDHIPYHEDATRATLLSAELSQETKQRYDLQSQIWLLIDDQKFRCTLVDYSNKYDLAVLKAEVVPGATPLSLSTKENFSPPTSVHAAGFPAVNDKALSREAIVKYLIQKKSSDIKSQFSRQALTLQVNSGTVNLTFAGDREVQTIKHQALVNPGNSGGPLLDKTGVVIGINTTVTRTNEEDAKNATFEAASYAPIISQMRREIDHHVPGVSWQD